MFHHTWFSAWDLKVMNKSCCIKLSHKERRFSRDNEATLEFYVNHSTVNLLLMCVMCLKIASILFSFPFQFFSSLLSNQHESRWKVKTIESNVLLCLARSSVIVRNIYRTSVQLTLLRETWNEVMRSTTKDWMEERER